MAENFTELVGVEETELVLLVRLPGDASVDVRLDYERVRLLREVRVVRPFRGIAGVQGGVETGEVGMVDLPSCRCEVPQLVANDRPADRSVDIVRLLERVHLCQAARTQFVREVVSLERGVDAGREERS